MRYGLLTALMLLGCGHDGGGDPPPARPSRFMGVYAGTWELVGDPTKHGALNVTIDSRGFMDGSLTAANVPDLIATVRGHIRDGGMWCGSGHWPGEDAHSIDGIWTVSDAGITGTMVEHVPFPGGIDDWRATVALVRQ